MRSIARRFATVAREGWCGVSATDGVALRGTDGRCPDDRRHRLRCVSLECGSRREMLRSARQLFPAVDLWRSRFEAYSSALTVNLEGKWAEGDAMRRLR